MEYTSKEIRLKNGKTCLLRLAEDSDAEMLLEYLKVTAAETRNMGREPEEVRTSVEEEVEFIRKNRENPRALHLLAFVDGAFAGSCSFAPMLRVSAAVTFRYSSNISASLSSARRIRQAFPFFSWISLLVYSIFLSLKAA